MGTLAPPPAYGSERGSILLESSSRGRPSEDIHRLQYSSHVNNIMNGAPPEAALDISLADITVSPPSYSSVDRYYERRHSFMSENSETYLLSGEQSDSRRTSFESSTRDQQRNG